MSELPDDVLELQRLAFRYFLDHTNVENGLVADNTRDSGETLTFFLEPATVGGLNNAVGSRVQVNYRLDGSRPIAIEVRGPKPGAAPMAATTTTLAPAAPAPAPSAARTPTPIPSPVEDVDVDVDVDTPPSPAYSATAGTELPATASKGPAIALFGLLALAAVALRAAR